MKKVFLSILMFGLVGLTSCSQIPIVSRDQIVKNLPLVMMLEGRFKTIAASVKMLSLMGALSLKEIKKIKKLYDVYYVYYIAANVHLTTGSVQEYHSFVKRAEKELETMEDIINKASGFFEEQVPKKSTTSSSLL